jgi:hypothetical protein
MVGHLLVVSRNYWGANMSEKTAIMFTEKFKEFMCLDDTCITKMIGGSVSVSGVKDTLYKVVRGVMERGYDRPVLYVYMNGHGNQVTDTSGDEMIGVMCSGETIKDSMDEVYQLPDGNVLDDDITDIIQRGVVESGSDGRLLVVFISDHCSSGSMIDKKLVDYDWVSIGSSLDNQDSYMTGDGNVMTCNLLSVLGKNGLKKCSAIEVYRLLEEEMKGSFIGDMQSCTIHVSSEEMLRECIFGVGGEYV